MIRTWVRINFALAIALTSVVIAVAQESANPTAGPKSTLSTTQALDQQLKTNYQLLERNRHLVGEIASLRNNPLASIPVNQVQTLGHLTDKNQQLQKENQELVDEVAAVRDKLAGPAKARTKVKAGKTIANIPVWLLSSVRRT